MKGLPWRSRGGPFVRCAPMHGAPLADAAWARAGEDDLGMSDPFREMIRRRKAGAAVGIPSFCCANELAIEALLEQGRSRPGLMVLIEGTVNQIGQFGGYTGMAPKGFRDRVRSIADRAGADKDRLILGGDHMGPLPWARLPAVEAMKNAKELVRLCVLAGFTKIHLDTSMRLGDDPRDARLPDEVIAERGVILLKECDAAYRELLREEPEAARPVYVIGSEVPIPGGAQEETGLEVTRPEDFEGALAAYRRKFKEHGIEELWDDVVAVVVQPGVEFSDRGIRPYGRKAAAELCGALKRHPDVVFEGHSTDHQPPRQLREMVEDGIAILKVGPALTFALREGLFALSRMEEELIPDTARRSCFIETLEAAMSTDPKHWERYYRGSEDELRLARRYSLSDRSRYYLSRPDVQTAMERLFHNIDASIGEAKLPMGMLSQYMPLQHRRALDGALAFRARDLVKDHVAQVGEVYHAACHE